jgi:putative peptidoglycan lipid II flippase
MDIIARITIPITFFSLAQGEILIRLLFMYRSFDETSVKLTLSAFTFHIPGLFFVALNRILAPAFYAQSDSRSPTIAGILSMAMNIILAVILVRHYKGAGIALALSIAAVANTVLLVFFLKKNPNITLGRALRSSIFYLMKIIFFSAIAVIPPVFLSPRLLLFFAGHGRIIAYGMPLFVNAVIFFALGIMLLFITKDKLLHGLVRMIFKTQKS